MRLQPGHMQLRSSVISGDFLLTLYPFPAHPQQGFVFLFYAPMVYHTVFPVACIIWNLWAMRCLFLTS